MSSHGDLTPTQRAALVAWHLAQGEGLTIGQIRTLGRYARRYRAHTLLVAVRNVVDVQCTDGETWSTQFTARTKPPQTARERAALLAYELATCGEVHYADISRRFGISRQAVFDLLCQMSAVLPLYQDRPGVWKVLTLREGEQ